MEEKIENSEKTEIKLINKLCEKVRNNLFKTLLIGSGLLASGIGINQRVQNNDKDYLNQNGQSYFSDNETLSIKNSFDSMFRTLESMKQENPNIEYETKDPVTENKQTDVSFDFKNIAYFDIKLTNDEIKLGKIVIKMLNDYSSNFDKAEFSDAMDLQRLIELLESMHIKNNDTLNHPLVTKFKYGKPREIIVSGVASDEAGIDSFGKSDEENIAIAKLRQENAIQKIELILALYKIKTKISKGENIEKVLDNSQIELIQKEATMNNLSVTELINRYNQNININESSIKELDELLPKNRAAKISIIYEDNQREIVRIPIPYILFILLGLKLYKGKK